VQARWQQRADRRCAAALFSLLSPLVARHEGLRHGLGTTSNVISETDN